MGEQENLTEKYWNKITAYCAFRERSTKEALDKLNSYEGIDQELVEELLSRLVDQGFIDEDRFAEVYARGKFNSRSWGKLKIANALRMKGVDPARIQSGLEKLEEKEYWEKAVSLAKKKVEKLDLGSRKDQSRLVAFLASKGYEYDIAFRALEEIRKQQD